MAADFGTQARALVANTTRGSGVFQRISKNQDGSYTIAYTTGDGPVQTFMVWLNGETLTTTSPVSPGGGSQGGSTTTTTTPGGGGGGAVSLEDADLSLIHGYFSAVANGQLIPNEEEFNKLVDRTWVRLAAQGFDATVRSQLIQTVLDTWQSNPQVVGAIMGVGGTGVGSIEPIDPGFSFTDQQLISLYGGTGSWIEDSYTDPYTGWNTQEGGFFGLTGLAIGDPGSPTSNGAGGRVAPTYRAPDEDVIREQIENHLKNVIGEFDDARVEGLLRQYMIADRANFDSKDQEINPWQVVKESTRQFLDYKALHKNRPSDVDESVWVATAIASARQQGVRESDQVARGQTAAKVGDLDASQRSFGIQQGDQTMPRFFQQAARAGQMLGNAVK